MMRRQVLATASALLLLGSTTIPTLASHTVGTRVVARKTAHHASLSTAMLYFAAFNRQERMSPAGDKVLDSLYAPSVTLTESLTTGRPMVHIGLQSARAFDAFNSLSWRVLSARQLSPTVILTTEQPFVRGPGHELDHATPWLTLITVKHGMISNLVWMPC